MLLFKQRAKINVFIVSRYMIKTNELKLLRNWQWNRKYYLNLPEQKLCAITNQNYVNIAMWANRGQLFIY